VLDLGREQIPPGLEPEVGQHLEVHQEGRENLLVRVVEVTEKSIKLDANHPLAGQNLIFDIELVAII
jgi:FKBP-type peptidyl-prolyl cis-trans isomerase 2